MKADDVYEYLAILHEIILEQGIVVAELFWDSGGPGAGAGIETVYLFRDLYWPHDSNEGFALGAFDSLQQALREHFQLTTGVLRVQCPGIPAERLARMLPRDGLDVGDEVELNGERWRLGQRNRLSRVVLTG